MGFQAQRSGLCPEARQEERPKRRVEISPRQAGGSSGESMLQFRSTITRIGE
jgi:hypothetical protein